METVAEIVERKQFEIDCLASVLFVLPEAASGDVLALSNSITRLVREHLQQIAKRTVKPEEH